MYWLFDISVWLWAISEDAHYYYNIDPLVVGLGGHEALIHPT